MLSGQLVSLLVTTTLPVELRQPVDCLDPFGAYAPRSTVGFNDFFFRVVQRFHQFCGGVQAVENFFVPKTQLCAIQVILEREVGLSGIAVALCQVKFVTRDKEGIFLDGKRPFQNGSVLLVFCCILPTRAVVDLVDLQPLRDDARATFRAFAKFMKDAAVNDLDFIAGQLRQKIRDTAGNDLQIIDIAVELRFEFCDVEAIIKIDDLIRVDHQRIIDGGLLAQFSERKGSVMGKVPPCLLNYLAWNSGVFEIAANDFLGSVARAGMDDQNIVDEGKST